MSSPFTKATKCCTCGLSESFSAAQSSRLEDSARKLIIREFCDCIPERPLARVTRELFCGLAGNPLEQVIFWDNSKDNNLTIFV